jgi:hypothetical protein
MSVQRSPASVNFELLPEPVRRSPSNHYPVRANLGLLPEPERSRPSFITNAVVNTAILDLVMYVGMTAKRVIEAHKFDQVELIFPKTRLPEPLRVKVLPTPKVDTPKIHEVKLDKPKINMPRIEKSPDLKPLQMEAKSALPTTKEAKPSIILAPQPKTALTPAAPAQVPQAKPSTAAVHLGKTLGVTPNPNVIRPATAAAIGNPYGGMEGPVVAPRGVVGSTGIGNGTRTGSNADTVGKVASAGIPGRTGKTTTASYSAGKVASAGIPTMQTTVAPASAVTFVPNSTNLEVIFKPPVPYASEARELHVQENVALRVRFTATGQMLVHEVLHGLGHGLDEERVGWRSRFDSIRPPATARRST